MRLEHLTNKLTNSAVNTVRSKKERFIELNSRLAALNPMSVLSRGYGAIFDDNKNVVKSVSDIKLGDKISVQVSDGTIYAVTTDVEGGNKTNG